MDQRSGAGPSGLLPLRWLEHLCQTVCEETPISTQPSAAALALPPPATYPALTIYEEGVSHILDWPACTHRHSDLQQLSGAASVKLPRASNPHHHHPSPKETQDNRSTWVELNNCRLQLPNWAGEGCGGQPEQLKGLLANPVRKPEHPSSSTGAAASPQASSLKNS